MTFTYLRILILVTGALLAKPLQASEVMIVNLKSQLCNQSAALRVGSGVLVKWRGGYHIISSDHVAIHANRGQGVCHKADVTGDGAFALELELEAANFGYGLAIFKIIKGDTEFAKDLVVFDPINLGNKNGTEKVVLAGFPEGSATLKTDANATLIDANSKKVSLPLIKSMIEVAGYGSYGMSGGGLLDKNGNLLGIISHHYLERFVGNPADGQRSNQIIPLAIPRATVVEWLKLVEAKSDRADLRFDYRSQIESSATLKTTLDEMSFSENPCLENQVAARAQGGHGVGIGGRPSAYKKLHAKKSLDCGIKISSSDAKLAQSWPFRRAKWLESARHYLSRCSALLVNEMVRDHERIAVNDLIEFFILAEQGWKPVLIVSQSCVGEISELTKEMRATARAASAKAAALLGLNSEKAAKDLLQQMINVSDLVNASWQNVDDRDFEKILDYEIDSDIGQGWKLLYADKFDETVELQTTLFKLRSQFSRVKL